MQLAGCGLSLVDNVCVLRAYGTNFDPDDYLRSAELQAAFVFHRGDLQIPDMPDGPRHEVSGIHFTVSSESWRSLVPQVADAERFLKTHRTELLRLATFPGLEQLALDFPLDLRLSEQTWMQTDTFPASLAKLAGEIGIDLEFSIYAPGDDE